MIDFKIWIDKHIGIFDENIHGLFIDSYKCFTNDIERPAYLLAYQGLMQYIRTLILNSSLTPHGFTAQEWENNFLKKLRDDGTWDQKVFDCTQQSDSNSGKGPILNIAKEIREKFPFWRQFRNVCAHYKGYEINKAHVIALYSFIEQYLEAITIEGCTQSLAQKFDNYFNPAITSLHEDITPLLDKIDPMVCDSEADVFLDNILRSCHLYDPYGERRLFVFHEIIHHCPLRVQNFTKKFMSNCTDFFHSYIEKYPDDILLFISSKQDIYGFCHNQITSYRNMLYILATFYIADLIPECDNNDMLKICIQAAQRHDTFFDYSRVTSDMKRKLYDKGYFHQFIESFFNANYTTSHYEAICYNTNFYIDTISILPQIDVEYVTNLIEIFSKQRYPFTLQDRLKEFYRNNIDCKTEVDKICRDNGLVLPDTII